MNDDPQRLQAELRELQKDIVHVERMIAALQNRLEGLHRKKNQLETLLAR